jgi:alginate O-acetyltransferase complex protein AlgJ
MSHLSKDPAARAALAAKPYHLLTREEVAELEVGTTNISPRMCLVFIGLFLLTMLGVPAIQHVIEIRKGYEEQGHFVLPQAYNAFAIPVDAIRVFNAPASGGSAPGGSFLNIWNRVQAANTHFMRDVKTYEKTQEDTSFLAVAAIPRTQEFTARYLGLGNEQVYLGRDGWLYYQPEVGHLTGEGFLRPDFLKSRARAGHAGEGIQPDPVKAIVQFRDQLKARGIHLIIMPAPVKPMLEPEHLSSRYDALKPLPIPLRNPSHVAFLQALEKEGVDVLDVADALAREKLKTGQSQFLLTDTHWTPQAMDIAAKLLADKIEPMLEPKDNVGLIRSGISIQNSGDIALMLKLPATSDLYPMQEAKLQHVTKPDDTPWKADPSASILVLGDSFFNIYSLEAMGWGSASGFVEQLSFYLQQPVDAILRNDAGAHATRELLARELAQKRNRLAGKKIVVWEFAARELSVGDWKLIDMKESDAGTTTDGPATGQPIAPAVASTNAPPASAAPSTSPEPAAPATAAKVFFAPQNGAAPLRISGTVRAASKFPRPGSVPYKDHIFAVHLGDIKGEGVSPGSQAVVYLFSMKDNTLTPASNWKAGDNVIMELRSWNDVSDKYDRFNRSELDDADLQMETPSWGEPAK